MSKRIAAGDVRRWERVFTDEDVARFAEVSHDLGRHHLERDAQGRLMVHGLLTATLPTKIGGDLDFLLRTTTMEFLRPVFVGDRVTCEVTITVVEPSAGRTRMACTFRCTNQHGKEVLRGTGDGVIRDSPDGA
jgi:acyl dehydratase